MDAGDGVDAVAVGDGKSVARLRARWVLILFGGGWSLFIVDEDSHATSGAAASKYLSV
jgi:hypothetical protein